MNQKANLSPCNFFEDKSIIITEMAVAGQSTLARGLALALGWRWLDSGLLMEKICGRGLEELSRTFPAMKKILETLPDKKSRQDI